MFLQGDDSFRNQEMKNISIGRGDFKPGNLEADYSSLERKLIKE
jgi:hypothetical protein